VTLTFGLRPQKIVKDMARIILHYTLKLHQDFSTHLGEVCGHKYAHTKRAYLN